MKTLLLLLIPLLLISCKKDDEVKKPPINYLGTYYNQNNSGNDEKNSIQITQINGNTYITNPSLNSTNGDLIQIILFSTQQGYSISYFYDICDKYPEFFVSGTGTITSNEIILDWKCNYIDTNYTLAIEDHHNIYQK